MNINYHNDNNENIFFSLDENQNQSDIEEENIDYSQFLNDVNDVNDNLSHTEVFEAKCYEYKINYKVKDLVLICEYYGISKEFKTNKCSKEEIIVILVSFENNPLNNEIVLRRQSMWYYINKLKNDKFMKKYVLW